MSREYSTKRKPWLRGDGKIQLTLFEVSTNSNASTPSYTTTRMRNAKNYLFVLLGSLLLITFWSSYSFYSSSAKGADVGHLNVISQPSGTAIPYLKNILGFKGAEPTGVKSVATELATSVSAAALPTASPKNDGSTSDNYTTTLVVGRLNKEVWGVQWIHDELPNLTSKAIYIVDDPGAPYHLDENNGRESMVYLTYIIDHYNELNDVTIFLHSSREAWHNNVLFRQDSVPMVNNLQPQWVIEKGYFNTRCELYPGCPDWILFNANKTVSDASNRLLDMFNTQLWHRLFPGQAEPELLSQPCCSQFAASRDAIHAVGLEQWIRIRDWLADAGVGDGYTGRIMEYLWHYIFLQKEQLCPSMKECYCKGYGVCFEDDTLLEEYNQLRIDVDYAGGRAGMLFGPNPVGDAQTVTDEFHRLDDKKKEYEDFLPRRLGLEKEG